MPLDVQQKEAEGIIILELRGRLVAGAEASDFRRRIEQLIAAGKNNLILDMKHVDFIDSTGLGTLVIAHNGVQKSGGAVKLLNVSQRNIQLMILTKLSTVFEMYDNEQAAINSFFPDREKKPFDILEFVKSQENEKTPTGETAEPKPGP